MKNFKLCHIVEEYQAKKARVKRQASKREIRFYEVGVLHSLV